MIGGEQQFVSLFSLFDWIESEKGISYGWFN